MSISSSSLRTQNGSGGSYYELEGKDGRLWKLFAVIDENDMSGLPCNGEDVDKWATQELNADGYSLYYNGFVPLPFVTYPLVSESSEGLTTDSDCVWCYCVQCGNMLAGKSVMALQIMVGIKTVEGPIQPEPERSRNWSNKKRGGKKRNARRKRKKKMGNVDDQLSRTTIHTRSTYLPRLLCRTCHEPSSSHTMYPLVALCFESLDLRMFKLMSTYERTFPLETTLKAIALKSGLYCKMCGVADKFPYCSKQCGEWHDLLVKFKVEALNQKKEEIREADEAVRDGFKSTNMILEEYVKDMLAYFKRKHLNINKRLRPLKCQNPRCRRTKRAGKELTRGLDCCSVCHRATYCSKQCQKSHYPEHKITCEYWDKVWDESKLVTLFTYKGNL